ncbi:hypothetical protein KEM54_006474 [Ascosphaera aggregata]|nr:hypothetical protein KEM54_006474 [Ascosphaera aggregata]
MGKSYAINAIGDSSFRRDMSSPVTPAPHDTEAADSAGLHYRIWSAPQAALARTAKALSLLVNDHYEMSKYALPPPFSLVRRLLPSMIGRYVPVASSHSFSEGAPTGFGTLKRTEVAMHVAERANL